jgi:hypothetical protein
LLTSAKVNPISAEIWVFSQLLKILYLYVSIIFNL